MRYFIFILSTLVVAGCSMESFDHKRTVKFDETSFGGGSEIHVEVDAGSLRIEATDTDVILISYEVRLSARDEETLKRIAEDVALVGERNGEVVTIYAPELTKESRRRGQRDYHVEIKVPEGARVRARCSVGSILATGLDAPHLEGAAGRVRLIEGTGAATLVSQVGRVSVKDHRGTATCTTTTGAIEASFRAVEGEGDMAFSTSVGSITIDVPEDTPVKFDAQTGAGSIDIPTSLREDSDGLKGVVGKTFTGSLNDGERPVVLRVKTGSITIKTH